MSGPPAVLKNLRIYATAVIANAQPQLGPRKRNFCFNLLRERMTKSVNQRLPDDLTGVIADNWIQGPRSALQSDLKRYRVLLCKFSTHRRERFGEVAMFFFRCSQTLDSIPPFDDHLVGTIESAFDQLASGLSDRYLGGPGLEAPHHALNALQKCVMQFARDTLPFRHPFSKPRVQPLSGPAKTQAMPTRQEHESRSDRGELEPGRFVKEWLLSDAVNHSRPVPNPVAIAHPYMERMRSSRYVGIDRVGRMAGIEPFGIDAVQPVLQTNLFRRRDLDGIEIQFEMMRARLQHQIVTGRLDVPADPDLPHINRWLAVRAREA